jgi:hypothetical protein
MRSSRRLLVGAVALVASGCGGKHAFDGHFTSPEALATSFLQLDARRGTTTTLVTKQAPEGGDRAVVTATLEGLLDDSVSSVRYVLVVRRDEEGWRLVSAHHTQRCRAGRGHAEFSADPCL